MTLDIFNILDHSIIFGENNSNAPYLKTKEEYLKDSYSKLAPFLKDEWNKDKKNPSRDGIINQYLQTHLLEILNAIDNGFEIPEKVLMQYDALRVIFF